MAKILAADRVKIDAMKLPDWVDRAKDIKVSIGKDPQGKNERQYSIDKELPTYLLRPNVLRINGEARIRRIEKGRTVEIGGNYYVVTRRGSLFVTLHRSKSVTTITGTSELEFDYALTRAFNSRYWRTA